MKKNLTDVAVRALKPAAKRYAVHDRSLRGLCVYVQPTGSKSWCVYHKAGGRPVRHLLGHFPQLDATGARRAYRAYFGEIAAGRFQSGRQVARTLNELFSTYVAVHARQKKKTWQRDVSEYDRLVRRPLGSRDVTKVARADIAGLLNKIRESNGKGPARKIRALLSKMFEVGIREGWMTTNPVRGLPRPEFEPRQRYLRGDEVAAFLSAVEGLKSETARDYFRLLLLTGARRSNVASMQWSHVDLERRRWAIPASQFKGKRLHVVPLTDAAFEVLRRRWEQRGKSDFVFPSDGPRGHYSNPKASFQRVLAAAGLADLRIHDLRRSVGAWMQSSGANLKTIQLMMGHSSIAVTAAVYAPVEETQVRQSLETAQAAFLSHVGMPRKQSVSQVPVSPA